MANGLTLHRTLDITSSEIWKKLRHGYTIVAETTQYINGTNQDRSDDQADDTGEIGGREPHNEEEAE